MKNYLKLFSKVAVVIAMIMIMIIIIAIIIMIIIIIIIITITICLAYPCYMSNIFMLYVIRATFHKVLC